MHSRNFVLLAALPLVLGPAAAVAAAPSTTSTSTTSPAFSTRINVGGGAYTDAAGRAWSADRYFSGGRAYTTPNTTPVTNTTESALFRTERVGMASYKIPVPANGIYNVRLRMAEIFHTASAKRVFSISAQGQPAVTDVDLVNRIGARTAYDVTVPVRTTIVSAISANELLKVAGIIETRNATIEGFIAALFVLWALTLSMAFILSRLERRLVFAR